MIYNLFGFAVVEILPLFLIMSQCFVLTKKPTAFWFNPIAYGILSFSQLRGGGGGGGAFWPALQKAKLG